MLKWKRTETGLISVHEPTSSMFEIVRFPFRERPTRKPVMMFELYVGGERYGDFGRLCDKKDVAEMILDGRIQRVGSVG